MEKRAEETLFFSSFEADESITPVNVPIEKFCLNMKSFSLEPGEGPSEVWCNQPNVGWSGARALRVNGVPAGAGKAKAFSVLFDKLNIKIEKNTVISYMLFPVIAKGSTYDKYDTASHIAIDMRFSDGTFLRGYTIPDVNGNVLSPLGQGMGRTVYANQWNEIRAELGYLHGKTITQILVGFETPKNNDSSLPEFNAYIDDIHIFNPEPKKINDVLDFVNILRGTNSSADYSRGLCIPAVAVPFGFNFWCPSNTDKGDDIYKYQPTGENTKLRHITISHEPSKWIGDRGTWQFMVNTSMNINKIKNGSQISASKRAALFSHNDEIALPNLYRVEFNEGAAAGSALQLTPTCHAASTVFMFKKDVENRNIIFDSVNAPGKIVIGGDKLSFSAYTDHCSGGMKRMYIYGTFNVPVVKHKVFGKQAILNFGSEGRIEMRVATSFISPAQAKHNLILETGRKTFIDLRTEARSKWLDKLNRVKIYGAAKEQLVTFYSCMYRLFLYPNLLSENVGTKAKPEWKYASPYSGSISKANINSGKMYYNNGFWDTYRTVWPALELLAPFETSELLNGIIEHYNVQGQIPRWIAPGGHNCMVGTNSDVIFADAMVKKIDFSVEKAYESAIKNGSAFSENIVNGGRLGNRESIFKGYTTSGIPEGLSWSMESYINDFGIARMADILGDTDNTAYYRNRALQYVNLFSSAKGGWFRGKTYDETMRGRIMNKLDSAAHLSALADSETSRRGYRAKPTFDKRKKSRLKLYSLANAVCNKLPKADIVKKKSEPSVTDEKFDPTVWGGDYTETNAWNMAFSVPHDGQGLINLYGGKDNFVKKLNEFFQADRTSFQIGTYSGMIHEMAEAREIRLGQYGHSNQPSHHIPYMYNYAGRPDRTAEIVRDILKRCYVGSSVGQGYCGDEDNGEMSAWYIFSALGFYPLSPASGTYAIGSPLFEKAVIHLQNGKSLTINAAGNNSKNIYVSAVRLNNKVIHRNYIRHSEIANGGTLDFTMCGEPAKLWGASVYDSVPSITTSNEIPAPLHDLTTPSTVTLAEPPTTRTVGNASYCAGQKLSALFDDHSASYVSLPLKNGKVSLYYHFENPVTVQIYTITSSIHPETAPIRLSLYGYNGKEWILIDRRESVSFKWERYTRPFEIDPVKRSTYSFYRLDMDGAEDTIEIAELEFLG